MQKVIYRIYSENNKLTNYVDYDPSKRNFVFDELQEWREKSSNDAIGIKSCSKNQKSFTKTPKGYNVIYIVLPKGKKEVTIAVRGGDVEEYLDIEIVPTLWDSEGNARAGEIIAKPNGCARIKIRTMCEEKDKETTCQTNSSYYFIEKKQSSELERV